MTTYELFPANWSASFEQKSRRIGIGFDVATTTNAKSNPSSITICQACGDIFFMRLVLAFKNRTPEVPLEIILHIARNLPYGLKIGKVCIDATSERFFASSFAKNLKKNGIPCDLIDSSASIEYLGEKMNYKCYLGNLLCNDFADGRIAMPNSEWLKNNIRQVYRTKGTFGADVDGSGNHADAFDSMKLARYAVDTSGKKARIEIPNFSKLRANNFPRSSKFKFTLPKRKLYT